MKRFSEQLKKKADTLRMRASERNELRDRIVSYMEYHPMPQETKAKMKQAPATLVGEEYATFTINFSYLSKFVGGLAVLMLVVVPFVAERAVPGDVLYPIKVRFNEEVRGTLAFSPYEKIEWETARLERRIAEARLLASEGKLTPEVEAEVAEAVKHHSDAAQKEIDSIRESDSEEAAIAEITFASALEVQSEVLEGHMENNDVASTSPEGHSIAAIVGAVDEVRAIAGVVNEHEPLSYEKLFARVESETTNAYEYFNSIGDVASEDERQDIERRLSDINTKVEMAIEMQETPEEATALLAEALTDTRKLISFMTNIDVRENVTIEELVPKVLTDEERTAEVLARTENAAELRDIVTARLPEVPEDILEKVTTGLELIDTALDTASSSLAAKNFDAADAASTEALAYAEDVDVLTKAQAVPDIEVAEPAEEGTASSTEAVPEETESTETGSEEEPVAEEVVTEEVDPVEEDIEPEPTETPEVTPEEEA